MTEPNPDYATLLPQIAAETDPVARAALEEQAYVFNTPLTAEELALFEYLEEDYVSDVDGDYDFFSSYVGNDYSPEGVSTLANLTALQTIEITGVTKSGGAPTETDITGTYTVNLTCSAPLTVQHNVTVQLYVTYGENGESQQLIGSTVANLLAGTTTFPVSVNATSSNAILAASNVDDIYVGTSSTVYARIDNVTRTETIQGATGNDFVLNVADVPTEYNPTTNIYLVSTTNNTSSVRIELTFDEEVKEEFTTSIRATAGSNVYNLTNAHTITVGTGTRFFSVLWGLPHGTNYYNTPGNTLDIEVFPSSTNQSTTAVSAGGFEAIRFSGRSLTTLVDQIPEALYSALNGFTLSSSISDIQTAIDSISGVQTLACIRDSNVAEDLSYRSGTQLTNVGYLRDRFRAPIGNSYGFTNPNLNGRPYYGIVGFNTNGYMGSAYVIISPLENITINTPAQIFSGVRAVSTDSSGVNPTLNPTDYLQIRVYGDDRTTNPTQPDIFEDDTDNLRWGFSSGSDHHLTTWMNSTYTGDFSDDDGIWGFADHGIVEGNLISSQGDPFPGNTYQGQTIQKAFWIANINDSDGNAQGAWGTNILNLTATNHRFFIFAGA